MKILSFFSTLLILNFAQAGIVRTDVDSYSFEAKILGLTCVNGDNFVPASCKSVDGSSSLRYCSVPHIGSSLTSITGNNIVTLGKIRSGEIQLRWIGDKQVGTLVEPHERGAVACSNGAKKIVISFEMVNTYNPANHTPSRAPVVPESTPNESDSDTDDGN